MATARKRPRPDEDTQAECPFTVTHPDPNEKDKKVKRRRQESEDQPAPKIPLQASPFPPLGKFKDPNNNMDRYYQVHPHQKWMDMTRYNSFVLNGVKYYSEGFIFVANSSTIERQKNPGETRQSRQKSDDDWVARILEIRASDEHHVYARVYWMYWPDELPPGTQEGKKTIQGRQSYHGQNELIASNHSRCGSLIMPLRTGTNRLAVDVINVVSVTAQATVNQWDEANEDEVQKALYWRQAFDVRNMELSSALPRCKCNRPENPDKQLINCANLECRRWLHDDCLVDEALIKTFSRLGVDKPHKPTRVKAEEPEGGQRPLSPSESGAAPMAQQSIDVKPEDQQTIKLADVENGGQLANAENGTVSTAASVAPKRKGRPRKSGMNEMNNSKPYEGLFSAVINDTSPPVVEIQDLRENVTGGEKSWTESLYCPLCSTEIH
ncbi:putative ebs-bah-phd domain-containing protein [Rosellinia necatrix]|uniref:Putative ebs-bah-phd domain-containing protein n=1 Tax=Rosellinia necatrix TaxID=77044 RepID=A0A1W2TSZ4_ROSNE|nr:putative ebs-bah-phd domain-containing protein [Rosellinia necatrix]